VPHYTISIILKKGIDHNALQYILGKHKPETIQSIDGWTKEHHISNNLAVIADPAHLTSLYGTKEDFLIPNACLGSTVSGLFSRTILNSEVIAENDFHGAAYFEYLEDKDVSYEFIESIEKQFDNTEPIEELSNNAGSQEAEEILRNLNLFDTCTITLGINERNLNLFDACTITLGINETTRSLLQSYPLKILVRSNSDTEYIEHIIQLAKDKQIPIEEYPLQNYRACAILKRTEVHLQCSSL